ncbi:pseudaminic acid synthase [Shewanella algidipiscicola]|uniref:pseudaminic acid synthase n=1 Tax=Shewanella algidipiscicola TaxID=614070 RepID=UPI000D78A50B|nr:pseudaminic acid synthase [Shewanella algidipiscicola]
MSINIAGKKIGLDQPTFIIAELSANHNQQLDVALATVKAAKEAGADAIKLQTYTADTLTLDCDSDHFKVNHGTLWDGETLYSLYQKAFTPWEWHQEIMDYAKQLGLICFSSPFDPTAVDFLADLDVPAYKIASAEITDIPLIDYVARQHKPIIISTGIARLADIELAVETCRKAGNNEIIILKCTSAYPTPLDEVDLNTIPNIRSTFGCEVGLSDHTLGTTVVAAAVALGARVVEKHFILDKTLGGPDADFSLDPQEFTTLVTTIRDTEKALGTVNYALSPKLTKLRQFSRSLFITQDVADGSVISLDNVRSVRPGFGLHPKYLEQLLGKKFRGSHAKGTPLSWEHIADAE